MSLKSTILFYLYLLILWSNPLFFLKKILAILKWKSQEYLVKFQEQWSALKVLSKM